MSLHRRRSESSGGASHEAAGMMRWLLTYADMITLLLAFFIVLYALSKINQQRYESLMQALRAILNGQKISALKVTKPVNPPYPPPSQVPGPTAAHLAPPEQALLRKLQAVVRRDHLQTSVLVEVLPQGIEVAFLNGVLFRLGQASLTPLAQHILSDLAVPLRTVPNVIAVQGYTDNLPIDTPVFHSNWDLSALRAARVVDFWQAKGLNPQRFFLEGFGQYSPLAPNTTAAGRMKNRRADVIILNTGSVSRRATILPGTGGPAP